MGLLFVLVTFTCSYMYMCLSSSMADTETLEDLQNAIRNEENKRVGFLSMTNYHSVRTVLPRNVEVVVCDSQGSHYGITCHSTNDLVHLVRNGTLLAALISGLPETHHTRHLHTFSSTLISPRAMFMAPDTCTDMPHGVPPERSSKHLSLALNAAIVRVQTKGLDQKARSENMPFEFMNVHSCKSDNYASFPVPNKNDSEGLLKTILDTKVFKLGAFGPFDWGGNDGNYLVDPPVGFYPDLMTTIFEEFKNLSGPNGVKYGSDIQLLRIWSKTSTFLHLFDGKSYATEPYYLVDGSYVGTGETCVNDTDCRASLLSGGHEQCSTYLNSSGGLTMNHTTGVPLRRCKHPERSRIDYFRFSCTTLGVDSTFFTRRTTKRNTVTSSTHDSNEITAGAIAAIVICCAIILIVLIMMSVLIYKERKGKPMFSRL